MISIRRISLFGGPGISKSSNAAYIFSRLKKSFVNDPNRLHIEQIHEYIKLWAYEKRIPDGWKQVYTFAKQLHREYIPLSNGVDVVITDSPLLLSCMYAKKYNTPGYQNLFSLTHEFEVQYPSLNILLERGDRPYVQSGRYQNEQEARQIDEDVENILKESNMVYHKMKHDDEDNIVEFCKSMI